MYQAAYYDRKTYEYHLRDEGLGWKSFKYNPYYYVEDPKGKFTTLEGEKVRPVRRYDRNNPFQYEKDVDRITRVLVDLYYKEDEPPKFHNILYLDIECEIAGALTPEVIKNAPTKITSIALYDNTIKTHYCFVLDEDGLLEETSEEGKFIIPCRSEEELLRRFLDKWEEIDPTIITGWNSVYFDIPFLYYRLKRVLGEDEAKRLSPLKRVDVSYYKGEEKLSLAGINHLDYMLLLKKFITKQEPSYRLGDVGEKYAKIGKIEYQGSLDKLFRDDVEKFIEYNIRDNEIVIELEKKLKFIELTVNICHLCHTTYESIYYSTVLNDGAILTYLKRKGIISPNKPTTVNPILKDMENDDYAGGYLKEPVPGLYEWVIDLDFTSLYPSIIRTLNIGIETYIGRVVNGGKYDSLKSFKELKEMDPTSMVTIEKLTKNKTVETSDIEVGKLIEFIEDNNIIVAASGAMFRSDKGSVVCEILTDWFNKRVEYKNLMKKAYKAGDKELGDFYNKRQHAYKIKLNDVYGVYAKNGWRYTDGWKRISSAITLTGQRLTKESIAFVNRWMNEKLGTEDKDYVVTSDTDSLFLQLKDLVKLRHPDIDWNDKQKVVDIILEYTTEIQQLTNEYLNELVNEMFNLNDREHFIELKQEVVLERGYFAGKRRYAMYIVNKEGVEVEELVLMGLDMMKSNFPPMFRKFGETILQEIMFGKGKDEIDTQILEFKENIKSADFEKVSKPTGVKKLAEYIAAGPENGQIWSKPGLKCPVNTKASIFYNDFLTHYGLDKKYPKIQIGDKIHVVYLKKNPLNVEVIAFKGYEDPPKLLEFVEEYIDRDKLFNSVMKNKLTGLYKDIGWDRPIMNKNVNKFFQF